MFQNDWSAAGTTASPTVARVTAQPPTSLFPTRMHPTLMHGERREEMRRIFDTEGDWGKLLEMFSGALPPES